MSTVKYSHEQLINRAKLTPEDMNEISQRRQPHNRLGFAYQLAYVRLFNQFPAQVAFVALDEILTFVSVQLNLATEAIADYTTRQQTISEHQEQIRLYLQLQRLGEAETQQLKQFLFDEACRLEQTSALLAKAEQFLQEHKILCPAQDTLVRLLVRQREEARQHIYQRISAALSDDCQRNLDKLIEVDESRFSPLQALKETPKRASPQAILRLLEKVEQIAGTGILTVDLSWLNNNYQRSLTRYVNRCSANRLRDLQATHRYAALSCFLWQTYRDTLDYTIDMHDKLMTSIYAQAEKEIDEYTRQQRRSLRHSLATFQRMGQVILDDAVDDKDLRNALFHQVTHAELAAQLETIGAWLTGKYSHVFYLVVKRFSYLRQFAPAFLQHLQFRSESEEHTSLLEAIDLLRQLNEENKRKLPEDAPLAFLPKNIQEMVVIKGEVNKAAWECALLNAVRDEIKSGNLHVHQSKRFGRFDDFFMPTSAWHTQRAEFFQRAGLPSQSEEVKDYLTHRLNQAYDQFLEYLPKNTYAQIQEDRWQFSTDPGEKLDAPTQERLDRLHQWLAEQMRTVKLPDLLIQVDNDLRFTDFFLPPAQQSVPPHNMARPTEEVCIILAALMAHGCNIGPYNMARLVENISYEQIKRVTDWQLSEEGQHSALAKVVNAISHLDVTQYWGAGKTSSSDGQRFSYRQKVLHQTYSHSFHDFAIEFYSFVADNYAPFYTVPIECTDRDAAYVLDGLLYNESDLALEEHFTDTHGYTEINFAAFALLGRRFSPRIRNLQKQRIYRIDTTKDYKSLTALLTPHDRILHIDWITDQWDRMGHFYASLESGHVTASTALKRLVSYSGRNHFYRASRELGRILKTEHILRYMSDPLLRQRTRRGLLKGEQIHALARDVGYGKQGRMTAQDWQGQKNSASCLTLLMACIIYWQAKEINRVLNECDPDVAGIDVSLVKHISPMGWDNVILYGEYVLNHALIQS
jgi:TnpA family transposase